MNKQACGTQITSMAAVYPPNVILRTFAGVWPDA